MTLRDIALLNLTPLYHHRTALDDTKHGFAFTIQNLTLRSLHTTQQDRTALCLYDTDPDTTALYCTFTMRCASLPYLTFTVLGRAEHCDTIPLLYLASLHYAQPIHYPAMRRLAIHSCPLTSANLAIAYHAITLLNHISRSRALPLRYITSRK